MSHHIFICVPPIDLSPVNPFSSREETMFNSSSAADPAHAAWHRVGVHYIFAERVSPLKAHVFFPAPHVIHSN